VAKDVKKDMKIEATDDYLVLHPAAKNHFGIVTWLIPQFRSRSGKLAFLENVEPFLRSPPEVSDTVIIWNEPKLVSRRRSLSSELRARRQQMALATKRRTPFDLFVIFGDHSPQSKRGTRLICKIFHEGVDQDALELLKLTLEPTQLDFSSKNSSLQRSLIQFGLLNSNGAPKRPCMAIQILEDVSASPKPTFKIYSILGELIFFIERLRQQKDRK